MTDKNELIIHIMHGYDSLEAPDGTKCFGVYLKGENEIYVASDIPDNQLFHTIAHEYCHYLQELENREFDEEEADTYANMLFDTEEHDKQIRAEAFDEVMNLPKHYYKTYEHGFVEEEQAIFISDIAKLKEQNK